MKILLTNDDGYTAQGIQALFDVLSVNHDVYMIAPSEERSACSNAITMRTPVDLKKISDRIYSLSGFPSDCINIAFFGNVIPEVDLVISGINHGPNMGDDVYFSGTVAGARTAFMNGKTGIAVSLSGDMTRARFKECAESICLFLELSLSSEKMLYNINYPQHPLDEIKGFTQTYLDKRRYIDHYKIIAHTESCTSMKLDGTVESENRPGSDVDSVNNGFISVTPLLLDATDYKHMDVLKSSLPHHVTAARS